MVCQKLVAALVLSVWGSVQGFSPVRRSVFNTARFTPLQSARASICDAPSEFGLASGATLRGLSLTSSSGAKVTLGDAMGTGVSVVIFLRHLG